MSTALSPLPVISLAAARCRQVLKPLTVGLLFFLALSVILRWTFGPNVAIADPSLRYISLSLLNSFLSLLIGLGTSAFVLSMLVRRNTAEDSFAHVPGLLWPLLLFTIVILFKSFLWLPVVGSLLLVLDPVGFGPLLGLLWIVGSVLALIRAPRFVCAPVLLLTEKLGVLKAIERSEEMTAGAWQTVAGSMILVAVVGAVAVMIITGLVTQLLVIPAQHLVTYTVAQALWLPVHALLTAIAVELTERLTRRA